MFESIARDGEAGSSWLESDRDTVVVAARERAAALATEDAKRLFAVLRDEFH